MGSDAATRSVGNTPALRETALVEAFNLKAAIEYSMENKDAAREALNDMPPRDEGELDQVSLHNLGRRALLVGSKVSLTELTIKFLRQKQLRQKQQYDNGHFELSPVARSLVFK